MRLLLILWFTPMVLMGTWYGLSAHDLNMGTMIFSRALHDEVMAVYSGILGISAEEIPPLLVKALVLDTLIVLAIVAWRRWSVVGPILGRAFSPVRNYVTRSRLSS